MQQEQRCKVLEDLLIVIQDAVAGTNHNHGFGRGRSPKVAVSNMKKLLKRLEIRDVTNDDLRYLDLTLTGGDHDC